MKKSISILGCGWLGKPLAHHLNQNGFTTQGSCTSIDKLEILKSEGISPFLIHIDDLPDDISRFLQSEILIISITSKKIAPYKNLIKKISSSPVKKVLFVSSTSVYDLSNDIITEKTPVKDSLLSSIEKLFINNSSFQTTIIRFGGLFGYDRQPGRFFINSNVIMQPNALVNYIHRDDCISIIEKIIEQDVWGEVFNAVTDSHPTKREFYTYMANIIGEKQPAFSDQGKSKYKIVSNKKIKEILNYQFKHADLMTYEPELVY